MIILYSTGCPRCKVLESALEESGIVYEKVSNEQDIIDMGFMTVPVLQADGKTMAFPEAYKYIKEICNGQT